MFEKAMASFVPSPAAVVYHDIRSAIHSKTNSSYLSLVSASEFILIPMLPKICFDVLFKYSGFPQSIALR